MIHLPWAKARKQSKRDELIGKALLAARALDRAANEHELRLVEVSQEIFRHEVIRPLEEAYAMSE